MATHPELEMAKEEATAALAPEWRLDRSDHERYSAGHAKLDTYSASAVGPGGEVVVAIATDEATAYRLLAQCLRGEVEQSPGWIPPLPAP